MNILATQYTLSTNSLEIYVAGCNGNPHCAHCHNPESWDFNNGEKFDEKFLDKVSEKITDFDDLIKNIMIFGGEPIDQNHKELESMLESLSNYRKPIWLFTRYSIDNVPDFVKKYCEYIKCGRYDSELVSDDNIQYGIKLSTSNQKIYKKDVDY